MADDVVAALLKECEAAAKLVSEPFRIPAFTVLLESRLGSRGSEVRLSDAPTTGPSRRAGNVAEVMKRARTSRERLVVAIHALDQSGTGVQLGAIRNAMIKYRQPQPKNIPRDIGELVKAGLVMPLDGKGRTATYALSASGIEIVEELAAGAD